MQAYFDLFFTFARVGLFTFGGGYAMLPLLEREVVRNKGWCTSEELMDMYAIGQCTPGIIAVNVSTYIGNKQKGPIGAIFSTLGIVSPSILIISILASVLTNFADLPIVQHAFGGIRIVVCALVTKTVSTMQKKNIKDIPSMLIFLLTFLAIVLIGVSPVFVVMIAGVAGVLIQRFYAAQKKGDK